MLVKPLSILLPSKSAKSDIDQHVFDAKSLFAEMRNKGSYDVLPNQMVVYRITDHNRSYTGIVLGVDTSEFRNETIVHHEHTIPTKVVKQSKVAKGQGGFSKPILLTNRAIPAVSAIMDRLTALTPIVDVRIEKYRAQHQIWPITSKSDLDIIIKAFSEKEKAYIVDGHHRTRAIEQLSNDADIPITSGLCAMFDIEQLDILPFHRIVDIEMPSTLLIEKLSQVGNLQALNGPRFPISQNEVVIIIEGKYFGLTWNKNKVGSIVQLDVNQLSQTILRDVLGIDQENTSSRVSYLEGNHTVQQIESKIKGTRKAAFLLHAISIEDLIDILNDGDILPPKSTFFMPRMANGILSMAWV